MEKGDCRDHKSTSSYGSVSGILLYLMQILRLEEYFGCAPNITILTGAATAHLLALYVVPNTDHYVLLPRRHNYGWFFF